MAALDLDSLSVLGSVIDAICDGLDGQDAEALNPATWQPLLAEAVNLAVELDIAGVSHLLRICAAAVGKQQRLDTAYDDGQRAALHGWFGQMARFCSANCSLIRPSALIEGLKQLPQMPPLPDSVSAFLLKQLSAIQAQLPSNVVAAPESAPADTAPSQAAFESAAHGRLFAPDQAYAMGEALAVDPGQAPTPTGNEVQDLPSVALEVSDPAVPDASQTLLADDAVPPTEIWISAEEMSLAADAVQTQLLPDLALLAQAESPDDRASALAELEFHLGLVAGALQLLGLTVLGRGLESMQAAAAADELPDPTDVSSLCAAVAHFLSDPDPDNAEVLAALFGLLPVGTDVWSAQLLDEASRVRIGTDPALIASRKTVATADDVSLEIAADVLPNVREGMLRELPGNSEQLGRAIRHLLRSGDSAPMDEARRVAHTLKGDANTVGVRGLANLTHVLEDVLLDLHKHPQRLNPALAHDLDRAADCVEEMADYLLGRGPEPSSPLIIYQAILDWSNRFFAGIDSPEELAQSAPATTNALAAGDSVLAPALAPMSAPMSTPALTAADDGVRTQSLSVPAALLDELQRLAGEALVTASQLEQRLRVLERMHADQRQERRHTRELLSKLDDLVSLRGIALQSASLRGNSEVDPLELDQYSELHVVSRQLIEAGADQDAHQQQLDVIYAELETLRSEQDNVHADLQTQVQRARMLPFEQISGRLQRIVRQTARQLGRDVELTLKGMNTLLDAELLDRIVEPLGHILRNAVDHGIEDPDERVRSGKPSAGHITIDVGIQGDMVDVRIDDDGRGLDYAGIRTKASALGLLDSERESTLAELAQLILTQGFSTREQATQVSGRGIGMDVVNQRVNELRGSLNLESQPGRGLSVRLRLPVSQTVANVLVVTGHQLVLGVVVSSIERVHGFNANELTLDEFGQAQLQVGDSLLPLLPVETLYGLPSQRSRGGTQALGLIVRDLNGRTHLIGVGSVGDVSQVVVKPISRHLPAIPAVRGMTLLGDGQLATVVDMVQLVNAYQRDGSEQPELLLTTELQQLPRVVVADDSLSVRRALSELMQDAGYEVMSARDGLEALELIDRTTPNLVLMDLEMPKLNGLEVTRFMRSRAIQRDIPVVMITSRAGDKYRAQAMEAGVTLMLAKPYSEDELVRVVRELSATQVSPSQLELA
ncbi:MAG: response regulator [Xanthomonadales bacterium]|nr:response regulator [Xanthomonadales bacterium]